jgi:hypothetical protein
MDTCRHDSRKDPESAWCLLGQLRGELRGN